MFPEELGGYKIRSESGITLVDEDNVNEAPESSYNILVWNMFNCKLRRNRFKFT